MTGGRARRRGLVRAASTPFLLACPQASRYRTWTMAACGEVFYPSNGRGKRGRSWPACTGGICYR